MDRGTGKLISNPEVLVLIYNCGYKEISYYNNRYQKFESFHALNTKELDVLEKIFINDSLREEQIIPKEIYSYLDINNFSFIVKSKVMELPFLVNNSVKMIKIKLPDLFFRIKNNSLIVMVLKGNVLYDNPLPNTLDSNIICLGNADLSFERENVLSKKIEMIKDTYFNSSFTNYNKDDEALESWFNLKRINYKKLKKNGILH